jgi:hypothetical protein
MTVRLRERERIAVPRELSSICILLDPLQHFAHPYPAYTQVTGELGLVCEESFSQHSRVRLLECGVVDWQSLSPYGLGMVNQSNIL